MTMVNPMDDMMGAAIDAAFGRVLQEMLQPILVAVKDLQAQVAGLEATQGALLLELETMKDRAKGSLIGRYLGV